MRAIYLFLAIVLTALPAVAAPSQGFEEWKRQFVISAAGQGIDSKTLRIFSQDAEFLPKVIELDRKQPEHKQTFREYYKSVMTDARINGGRKAMKANWDALFAAETKYGVPAQIITALWGMETSYGGYTGNWGILSTLATLAYEGRRADFFRGELLTALRIMERGEIAPSKMRGSWAGAMGQNQFMPSSYMAYAVDGDGDGRRDIWGSLPDVFASTANYLHQSGWQKDLPWGTMATAKHPIAKGFVGWDKDQGRSMQSWEKVGVHADGFFRVPNDEKVWLIAPDGLDGPKYLVTRNYRVIMKWNKSTYFASAVGRLSDHLKPIWFSYEEPENPKNYNE